MPNPLSTYFRGAYEELRKIAWPTKRETIQHTILVVGLSLVVAAFLGALDYAFNLGLEKLVFNR